MGELVFVRVTDGFHEILFPISRVDCVLRTDREERDDIVRIIDDEKIYTAYDDMGTGSFANCIVDFNGCVNGNEMYSYKVNVVKQFEKDTEEV